MQLKMTSQRYDRQQLRDRSPERTVRRNTEVRGDPSASISPPPLPSQPTLSLSHSSQKPDRQHCSRAGGPLKPGARRMVGGNIKGPLRRDDGCQVHTPSGVSVPISDSLQSSTIASRRLNVKTSGLLRCEWVNLEGLIQCALVRLGKEECTRICELGRGSHNSLYKLEFSDSTLCAASISNSPPLYFSADVKRSEIATMQYLHSSPLYNIPVPRIYAWDLTFDNPVGAPYIFRECVPGKTMSEDGRFYKLSPEDKLKVIKELAYVQAELSKPSEFTKLGCIFQSKDGDKGFYIGKMVTLPSGCPEEDCQRQAYLGPYDSLPELWDARLEKETLSAIRNWSALPSDSSLPSHLPPSKANPHEFGEILQLLSGLTVLFTPPKELSTLCIHHSDLAIRNVLFDEDTLKITGVIDWEFASVMPRVVTGRFPNDLGWEGNEFARSLGKLGNVPQGEVWNHHYYDWTSLNGVAPPAHSAMPSPPESPSNPTPQGRQEDYLTAPTASTSGCVHQSDYVDPNEMPTPSPPSPPLPAPPTSETSQQDLNSRASHLIELFYYRKFYASRVASRDFSLTRLFIDSVAYLKFNEIVMGGAEKWFSAAEWISEVFWRLQDEDAVMRENLMKGKGLVRVPEVFECARRRVVDLGGLEKRLRPLGNGGRNGGGAGIGARASDER